MDRFYISDLDKTILDDNGKLKQTTEDKIKLILQNNIKFTVATARSFNSVKQIFNSIELKYPIIELNGTMLTDFKTEKHYFINKIDYNIVKNIVDYAHNLSLYPFYTTMNLNNIGNLYPPMITNEGSRWFIDDRVKYRDDRLSKNSVELESIINEKLLSLTFIYRYDKLLELKKYIETSIYKEEISIDFFSNPYSEGWHWLTILSNSSQKGIAVKKLKKILSLEDHEIIVFGDNLNDCNMFRVADRSYAVKNAKKELKDIATDVIGYSKDDAVLDFIIKENNIVV